MSQPSLPCSALVSQLLEPISADAPCGVSLRYDAAYDRLKDLRREDDASLPTGVWSSEVKRADWNEVHRFATQLLNERSKDLMVAAWLGEAWLHKNALTGIVDALALLSGLCERYPDELHPRDEDGDHSWRAAPLDWMARRYADVLHTRLALFAESASDFENFSLHDWQQMQRRQVLINDSKPAKVAAEAALKQQNKINELVRSTSVSWWMQCLSTMQAALAQLKVLESWSDRHLGDMAPGFAPLQKVLMALESLFKEFIAVHPPQLMPQENASDDANGTADATPVRLFSEPRSRDEAYRQLLVIADYLARTEPHSPVPYLIKRGVEWGNKPLKELLSELISSDAESRRLWTLMGVL